MDSDATHWRDLADQLTRDQITRLEEHEHATSYAADPLEIAREMAHQNMIEQIFSPDPLPPDAVGSFGWKARDDGRWSRCFEGRRFVIEDAVTVTVEIVDPDDPAATWDEVSTRRREPVNFWVAVEIEGEQFTDGSINRWMSLNYGPMVQTIEVTEEGWPDLFEEFDGATARRIAAALAEAADAIEKLS